MDGNDTTPVPDLFPAGSAGAFLSSLGGTGLIDALMSLTGVRRVEAQAIERMVTPGNLV